MALPFEVETLEGLDEKIATLYIRVGDKYRLEVEGIDSADEIKNALKKEREARSEAEKRAKAFEHEKSEAEKKRLEEQKEYEKLWKQEQEEKTMTAKELAELKSKIAEGERDRMAFEAISGMSDDPAKAKLLKQEALSFIQSTPDGLKIGPNGDMDIKGLSAHLEKAYPFLCNGSKAGGGGSQGGGGTPKQDYSKLSPVERINAARAQGVK